LGSVWAHTVNFRELSREIMSFNRDQQSEKFNLLKEIGRGATSRVFLAEAKDSNDLVAIKEIAISKKIEKPSIFREIDVMRRIDHQNVLRCLSYDASEARIRIILEYCPLGSLADLITVRLVQKCFYKKA